MQEKDNMEVDTQAVGDGTGIEGSGVENTPEVKDEASKGLKAEASAESKAESGTEPKDEENTEPKDETAEELEALKAELEEKSKKCDEYFTLLQSTAAEFDNYRKRTAKEKELLYTDAVSDVVAAFLPVVDNIERALEACSKKENEQSVKEIKEGIELIYRQVNDVLKKLGVEQIKSVGEEFNPEFHNAVMHVEDEAYGKNVVVEEFQKGYLYKDRVIRHSMVKVAN